MTGPAVPKPSLLPISRVSYIVPETGSYVVFTLSPIATLEDPIAEAEAPALKTRHYVGYISQTIDLPWHERKYHAYHRATLPIEREAAEESIEDLRTTSRNSSSEDGSSACSVPDVLADPFGAQEDPSQRLMPVVDFDIDLSKVTEFTDARHLLEEIAAVDRIRASSEERSRERVESLEKARLENEGCSDTTQVMHDKPNSPSLTLLRSKRGTRRRILGLFGKL
ncbi:hypothetical protein FA95DRAFT_1679680 [Auriscalpium vulgare]|uniref:Uncharacterized protein n=1 Tax=Auriscalpium vulgare TaxID=40419 RepID=A0ACB8RRE5_9AGAM|nr:hypothetical protein FA95DRAFT_1679680 [Auriscalpium vulgare]